MIKPTTHMDHKASFFSMRSALVICLFSAVFQESLAQCTSAFSIGPNDTICINENLTLTDLSFGGTTIAFWQWSANGSQLPGGSPISSFSAPNEGVYVIELQAFDNLGAQCDPASQTVVVLGNPAVELTATEISCAEACDGGMQVTFFSDNEAAYTATWVGIGGSAPLTDLCPGIYTALITDDFGCTGPVYSIQDQLFEPVLLEANMLTGNTVQSCPGGQAIALDLDIQGGTPEVTGEYSVSWSPSTGLSASNIEDPVLSPLATNMNQTFTASITDSRGCETTAQVTLAPLTSEVGGEITIGGQPCTACEVYLLEDGVAGWDTIDHVATDVITGQYYFQVVPGITQFRLMADPDNLIYPTALQTFYGAPDPTYLWQDAFVLNSGCSILTTKDIEVIVPPTQEGQCTLSGTLWSYDGPGKLQAEFDPIPLIDVVVEKTPPGTPQGKSTTDENGEFEFQFMESDAALYTLYVNLPGIPMMETYSITIDPNDLLYAQLDLCVDIDANGIYRCGSLNVEEGSEADQKIGIYPNPNNGDFTLRTGRFEGSQITLHLFDVSGRSVHEMTLENAPSQIEMKSISAGYYTAVIRSSVGYETVPVSVLGF